MLPEFELLRPADLAEALGLLAKHGADAMVVAGGTNVVVDLRAGMHHPAALLDLGHLRELRGLRRADGAIVAGARTTLAEVLESPLVAEHAPVLRSAAALFANPLVRNRATVGGNLVDASPAADTAPPLLALDAQVELTSQAGSRWVPLADFMVGVRRTLRRPDELLTAVRWPAATRASSSAYHKIGLRRADAISVLSAAVTLVHEGNHCVSACIALGALAPRPFRAVEAEQLLAGATLTPATISEAARLAAAATRPISDIRGSAVYRRQVAEVVVRRLLTQAATAGS